MKNPRKSFLHYMKEKSDFIENLTGIKLYIESDYNWAQTLHEEDVKKIMHKMIYKVNLKRNRADSSTCPQCLIFDEYGCEECAYVSTHKMCNKEDSTYNKIITSLETSIVKAIGIETLRLYFKWNWNK